VVSCCERLTGYFRRAVRAAVLFMATPSAAAALATAAAANTPTIALGVDPLFEEWEMPSTLPQLAMCISNLALEQTNTFEKTDAATAGEEVPTAEAEESGSGVKRKLDDSGGAAASDGSTAEAPAKMQSWKNSEWKKDWGYGCSSREIAGFHKMTVRFSPVTSWQQRIVWVHPETTADDLKWWLAPKLAADSSTWRVVGGCAGVPWRRHDKICEAAPMAGDGAVPDPIAVIVPSFG
jgi:hypothetical protein